MTKWKYNSDEDLVKEGYRRCAFTKCPECRRRVVIYMRDNEFPLMLNTTTFRPHLEAKHIPGNDEPEEPPGTQLSLDAKSRAAGEREPE
jgi:hypothetical protein